MRLKKYKIQIFNNIYEVYGIIKWKYKVYYLLDEHTPYITGICYHAHTEIYRSVIFKKQNFYGSIKYSSDIIKHIGKSLKIETDKFRFNK